MYLLPREKDVGISEGIYLPRRVNSLTQKLIGEVRANRETEHGPEFGHEKVSAESRKNSRQKNVGFFLTLSSLK